MIQLKIIVASTREGRKGPAIASWIMDEAKARPEFNVELLDLRTINLPFLDEPEHPRLKKYSKQSTKDWSAIVDGADAFIAVMPEYNYGFNAPLKNALDTVFQEWHNKPFAFVSYGGVSGGIRAQQLLKPVILALQMIPVFESVTIPFFAKRINEQGIFTPDDILQGSASRMFNELAHWSTLLNESRKATTRKQSTP